MQPSMRENRWSTNVNRFQGVEVCLNRRDCHVSEDDKNFSSMRRYVRFHVNLSAILIVSVNCFKWTVFNKIKNISVSRASSITFHVSRRVVDPVSLPELTAVP